ncbi:hypothetical protein [Streptomyces sp. NPDC053079]|uniref:hypothetical protein n=1 Tax=Streptomyces sp. NPDC053079 TaxID=3365697 RepID=UPI0037D97060
MHLPWLFPPAAVLALLGLIACGRKRPGRYALPALQTTALITFAVAYVAALFRWGTP